MHILDLKNGQGARDAKNAIFSNKLCIENAHFWTPDFFMKKWVLARTALDSGNVEVFVHAGQRFDAQPFILPVCQRPKVRLCQ